MKKQNRFLKSIVETAKANEQTQMPWARGKRRAVMIERREAEAAPTLKRA